MPSLDIQAIRDILPHRFPMLLVDRIEELEADRVVGIKNVTANEPFFMGHFPDFPVMPGVMILEAMAQVAGVLVLSSIPDRHTKLVLLASVEQAKFRKPVRPGDQLRIEMKVAKRKETIAKMFGTATREWRGGGGGRNALRVGRPARRATADADSSDSDRRSRSARRSIRGHRSLFGDRRGRRRSALARVIKGHVFMEGPPRSAKTTFSFRIRPWAWRRRT